MKSIKHVIWDWNGTLFDDVELCREIINGILTRRNLNSLSLDDYRNIFTFPVQNYYEAAGLDFNKYTFELLGKEWMDEYESRKKECSLHKNSLEVLEYLNKKGIQQSILSAYSQHTLEEIVRQFEIDKYFSNLVGLDHIYATSKVDNGKKLIAKIKEDKREVLFIGDTVHDFEVANEIGVECILIADGHQEKQKLEDCGVQVFDSLNKIPFNDLLAR